VSVSFFGEVGIDCSIYRQLPYVARILAILFVYQRLILSVALSSLLLVSLFSI